MSTKKLHAAFMLGSILATLSWGVGAKGLSSDFDGDGHADIVVGVPLDDVDGAKNVGTVQVFYGCDQGLPARNQVLGLDDPQIPDSPVPGDQFGSALGWGDFNGDGFADLAIGAPFKAVGSKREAGKVYVVYGSANGLDTQTSQTWIQGGSSNIADRPDAGDWFGAALAAGQRHAPAEVEGPVRVHQRRPRLDRERAAPLVQGASLLPPYQTVPLENQEPS